MARSRPASIWALAPAEPKHASSATEYERILLACEPPADIRDSQQTLQLNDVLMYGAPYRLRVHAHLVPNAPVEYEATLERVGEEALAGRKYSCIGATDAVIASRAEQAAGRRKICA